MSSAKEITLRDSRNTCHEDVTITFNIKGMALQKYGMEIQT